MERTDWLDGGFDSAESRFLMVTAITHHGFNSAVWGEHEIRKLFAELAEIEASAAGALAAMRMQSPGSAATRPLKLCPADAVAPDTGGIYPHYVRPFTLGPRPDPGV